MSQTYVMLMNKMEVSIKRGEDLAQYVKLADAYLLRNRITVEEYELVMARIEEVEAEREQVTTK